MPKMNGIDSDPLPRQAPVLGRRYTNPIPSKQQPSGLGILASLAVPGRIIESPMADWFTILAQEIPTPNPRVSLECPTPECLKKAYLNQCVFIRSKIIVVGRHTADQRHSSPLPSGAWPLAGQCRTPCHVGHSRETLALGTPGTLALGIPGKSNNATPKVKKKANQTFLVSHWQGLASRCQSNHSWHDAVVAGRSGRE